MSRRKSQSPRSSEFKPPEHLSDIARRSGLSLSHISRILRSRTRKPSMDAAARIAAARGITLDRLYQELSSKIA